MIKLIIFDLDGVLISTKEWHYESLNKALNLIDSKYAISYDDHINIYDGLPTLDKLKILTERKGLPVNTYKYIFDNKQEYTFDLIKKEVKPDQKLIEIFSKLKKEKYQIYIASNAIRETIKLIILKLGIMEYIDNFISNEDVKNSKPSPEIYFKCMIQANCIPKETIIIEDSPKGIAGAIDSGSNVLIVKNPDDLTYEKIRDKINKNKQKINMIPIDNLNILIPMAGEGSRFKNAGYTFPKPLIEVNGKPMIQVVTENLGFKANYIYIVRKEHYDKYHLSNFLNLITPGCKIVTVDSLTEGAACTTLLAKEYIDNDNSLLIANSDQYIDWNPLQFYYNMIEKKVDGGILTFEATHPKWSFVAVNDFGYITEVAEKKPISNIATVGIYYWSKGSEYVKYAEQMIEKDIRVNNEFYVAPVYNEAINDGKKIIPYNIDKMWGIGTPEDLNIFLNDKK